jgi:hypothetical protein
MDHDTIDTMTVYRGDGKHPLRQLIDALTHQSLNRLILTALFDCFFSSSTLPSMLQHVASQFGSFGRRSEMGQRHRTSLDDGCQGQSKPTLRPLVTSIDIIPAPCNGIAHRCSSSMQQGIDSTRPDSVLRTIIERKLPILSEWNSLGFC